MEGRFEDDQAASPFTSYFLDTEESNLPSFGEPPPSSRNISPSRGIMSSYQSPWGYGEPESGTDTSAGSLSDNASSLVPFQDHNHQSRKRRGHTKSRLGCISCKKRKIKVCQSTCPGKYTSADSKFSVSGNMAAMRKLCEKGDSLRVSHNLQPKTA